MPGPVAAGGPHADSEAMRRMIFALALPLALLAACTGGPSGERTPTVVAPSTTAPPTAPTAPTTPAAPSATPSAEPFAAGPELPAATAQPQDVLTGLSAPWGLAFLPGGAVLVTLRDSAQVLLLDADGVAPLGGPGAEQLASGTVHVGESGLLGVAVSPTVEQDHLVYLYRTAADGNQVVRAEIDPAAGTLGELQPVLTGIPSADHHDGGRIAFGPDGMLYVGTGDAGDRPLSQDPASLGGKILRLTPDGAAAPGNPFTGNPVWSLGHRNVQGLGWDSSGRMFASEFGQNTWDELNIILPGGNYGWPGAEGVTGASGTIDPVATWATDAASPSGIAVTSDAVYLAALKGQRLWKVPVGPAAGGGVGEPVVALDGLGRLRAVAVGPDGALWVLTNNTDGRGSPRAGDDRLLRLSPP